MESWLVDVKRVRIPRPKFGARSYPREPPTDYCGASGGQDADDVAAKQRRDAARELARATEELRRAVRDKL